MNGFNRYLYLNLNLNLSLKSYYILLVKPETNVNTKEAYSLISNYELGIRNRESKITNYELGIRNRESVYTLISKPIIEWKDCLQNDFELENEKLIYYKYENTKFPHAGAGLRVSF